MHLMVAGILSALALPLGGPAAEAAARVTVSPAAVSLAANGTQQFQASVTGSFRHAVIWVVNGVPGGSPSLGTITAAGLYTAPADASQPMAVTVAAISAVAPLSVGAAAVSVDASHYVGATYFVSPAGSDSAPGTSAGQAWRTIQHAVSSVPPGSTILVAAGTYNELVTITRSGSATAGFITLEAATGAAAIIDGTGQGVPGGTQGLITLQNVQYVRVSGFELRNYTTSSASTVPAGIFISGTGDHIEVRNNHIHDISTTVTDSSGNAFGLAVYGTAVTPITNLVIDGNELDHLVTGYSESLSVNGNVQYWQVTNNKVHDNNNIGIVAIGFEGTAPPAGIDQARNGWIAGNDVYNITSTINPAYNGKAGADGIYVDGGTQITIEDNLVEAADLGIELASEHQGRYTSWVTARDNLVLRSNIAGISIGGYAANVGGTRNCSIVNNTLFENDTMQSGSGEFQIQYNAGNNLVANNILYANDQGLLVNSFVPSGASPAVLEDNLYFTSGGAAAASWIWNNQVISSLAAFQRAGAGEARGVLADPLFVSTSTPNLQVTSASPAIDTGVNLGLALEGSCSYGGTQRRTLRGPIDRGAY